MAIVSRKFWNPPSELMLPPTTLVVVSWSDTARVLSGLTARTTLAAMSTRWMLMSPPLSPPAKKQAMLLLTQSMKIRPETLLSDAARRSPLFVAWRLTVVLPRSSERMKMSKLTPIAPTRVTAWLGLKKSLTSIPSSTPLKIAARSVGGGAWPSSRVCCPSQIASPLLTAPALGLSAGERL